MGSKRPLSAELYRFITELNLIEEFHWLPQDIAKIPYKWLEMLFIVRERRDVAKSVKNELQHVQQELKSAASNINRGGKRIVTTKIA